MVNWAGAVARVLNGEDGLASHFSRPIDRCSGGATTGAKLSLPHHHTITLISISPATITPPRDVHAQGYELVASARPPPPQKKRNISPVVSLEARELRTFL